MSTVVLRSVVAAIFVLVLLFGQAVAEERTVVGTIIQLDPAGGVLVVRDAAGASWTFKVDAGSGIDLLVYRPGDRVKVSIGRATPLNMITTGDFLRKGDRIELAPY